MIEKLTDIVLNVTGFQLLLLIIVVLSTRVGNHKSRWLLAAFLFSKILLILRWMGFRYGLFSYSEDVLLYKASCSFFFLLAPFVFLYVLSICYKNYQLKLKHLLHFIPFLLFIIYSLLSFYYQQKIDQNGSATNSLFITRYWKIFWTFNLIQICIYIILLFRTVKWYKKRIRNFYTDIDKINLNWLFFLLILISCHWVFIISRSILSLTNIEAVNFTRIIDVFSISIFLVFTTALVLRGLSHIKIFPGIEITTRTNGNKIDVEEKEKCVEKLDQLINTSKPYLIPSLTIEELSKMLSIQSWKLSHIINQNYKQNFFNFINKFRIEEFKKQVLEPSNKRKTVLELIYEVGFNSKSSFNDVFKKETGMTPTQFKKEYQK